jgi:hypothetical protein
MGKDGTALPPAVRVVEGTNDALGVTDMEPLAVAVEVEVEVPERGTPDLEAVLVGDGVGVEGT